MAKTSIFSFSTVFSIFSIILSFLPHLICRLKILSNWNGICIRRLVKSKFLFIMRLLLIYATFHLHIKNSLLSCSFFYAVFQWVITLHYGYCIHTPLLLCSCAIRLARRKAWVCDSGSLLLLFLLMLLLCLLLSEKVYPIPGRSFSNLLLTLIRRKNVRLLQIRAICRLQN